MTWYVYALKDPRDGSIRYVGKSANPAKRLASHTSASAAKPIRSWLTELGTDPVLDVLAETGTETEALLLEQGWIAKLRASGVRLLNGTVGGDQPHRRRPAKFVGIGTRIEARRKALGLSQGELARLADFDAPKISRMESGKRTGVTAETAVLIARALGVTVEWLVTGEPTVALAEAR